jgi:hypothetical protein
MRVAVRMAVPRGMRAIVIMTVIMCVAARVPALVFVGVPM